MNNAVRAVRVSVRVESAADLAARLPSMPGVVSIPRLAGWASKHFKDLATRVQGEIVRAVTSRDLRKSVLAGALRSHLDEASAAVTAHGGNSTESRRKATVLNASKRWCIERRLDPDAMEVLSESKEALLDGAAVSAVLDASQHFGEMGRSRVVGAMAQRLLALSSALTFPEGVSRVIAAAKDLPWEAPAHEDIAKAAVHLEGELFYEASVEERERFELAVGGAVTDLVAHYAQHPRIAVLQHVALKSERADVLQEIAGRAQAVFALDSRMTFRLVEALATNPAATPDVLRPFAKAEFWTKNEREQVALNAMLARALLVPPQSVEAESDLASVEVAP